MASAYLELGRPDEAATHVKVLLGKSPESVNAQLAAVRYHQALGNPRKVLEHCAEGQRISPERGVFYYFAAVAEANRLKFKEAQRWIDRAIQCDPQNADYRNLGIRISGALQTDAASSWRRVDELIEALKLEPDNPRVHNTLGDVYLEELNDPRTAERYYREALRLNPVNRHYQRDLFQSVAERNLLYRLLNVPTRVFGYLCSLGRLVRHQLWRLLLLPFLMKPIVVFLIWLLATTLLFWPAGKFYEWLLVSEIRNSSQSSDRRLRLWMWFHRWPILLRFALFLAGLMVGYSGLFLLLNIPLGVGYTALGTLTGFNFVIILVLSGLKAFRTARGRRRHHKHVRPPPIQGPADPDQPPNRKVRQDPRWVISSAPSNPDGSQENP